VPSAINIHFAAKLGYHLCYATSGLRATEVTCLE
jgi:hypothetical protein